MADTPSQGTDEGAPHDPAESIIPRQPTREPGFEAPLAARSVAETAMWVLSSETAQIPATKSVAARSTSGGDLPQLPTGPTFELLRVVGRGGMGEVWEARQLALRRNVAVKTIRPDAWEGSRGNKAEQDAQRVAFMQEALIAARLDHPNIVPVYDLGHGSAGGPPLLAMKLVEGESWAQILLRDFPRMGAEDLLAKHLPILVDVAQAVSFAHSRGIVHRDLKPAQVMTGSFGEALLMDWGLAVYVGESVADSGSGLPPTGPLGLPTPESASNPAGTPAMMAPEQAVETAAGIGTWTDVYLLGGILYFLLTGGKFPHEIPVGFRNLTSEMLERVTPPSQRTPGRGIPSELEALCMHALASNPSERVKSAHAFVDALSLFQSGSGRRRESEEVAARAGERFAALAGEKALGHVDPLDLYDRHGAVEEEVARALELWPGNQTARTLKAANLAARVEAEVTNGDLLIARAHLRQLEGIAQGTSSNTEALSGRLSAAEKLRSRHRRQRAAFAAAAAVLFLCAIGFAFVSHANANRAKANLAIAEEQGKGAETLVLYVLDELKGELESQLTIERGLTLAAANEVRHGIGDAVGARITAYYEELDATGWPVDLQLQLADQMQRTWSRFFEMGNHERARKLIEMELKLLDSLNLPPDKRTADCHACLAKIERFYLRFDEAEAHITKSLAIWDKIVGRTDMNRAASLAGLGEIRRGQGRLAEAETLHAEVVEILSAPPVRDAVQLARAYRQLAGVRMEMAKYDLALEGFTKSLELTLATSDGADRDVATAKNSMAIILATMGQREKSIPLLEEALAIWEQLDGPNSVNAAAVRLNLADCYVHTNQAGKAEGVARQAVAVRERAYGPEHAETGHALAILASVLEALDRNDEAESAYLRALAIREKGLGANHPNVAVTANNLGALYYKLQRYDEAAAMFTRSLNITEARLGPDHARLINMLANIAAVERKNNNLARSRELFQRALAICEKSFGADHAETKRKAEQLLAVLEELDDSEAAAAIREKYIATSP